MDTSQTLLARPDRCGTGIVSDEHLVRLLSSAEWERIVDELTRREVIVGGLSLAAVLSGCGDDDAASNSSDDTAPDRSGAQRSVRHAFGETAIEGDPERIVSIGLTDQDALFALGAQPVAIKAWFDDTVVYPWSEEAADGAATEMLPTGEINIEAVAALNPDLIVGISGGLTEEQYDLLSEIAPTIAQAPDSESLGTPWQEQTLMIGRALGREREAEELITATDERFADAAARHPEWADAPAVLASQVIDGQVLLYPAGGPAASVLELLGFVIPAELDEFFDDTFNATALSAERLDLLDVDLILWDQSEELLEPSGVLELPSFTSLDAVQEGRVVFSSEQVGSALAFGTVLSRRFALEQLEPQIVAAFDGDPST